MTDSKFSLAMTNGYAFEGSTLLLGAPLHEGIVAAGACVCVPLAMMNRHGLIAGATGTGKTKTLQLLAGQLSDAGVPVFLADQLRPGGVAVVPVGPPKSQSLVKVTKTDQGLEERILCDCAFVPLIGKDGWAGQESH